MPRTERATKLRRSERTGESCTHSSPDRVLRELCLIGFSNMADFVVAYEDGTATLDFSNMSRDQAAAIQEFVVDEYMDGRGEDARPVKRTRFKLADKKGALVEIGRHLGMFTDKLKVDSDITVIIKQYPAPVD